MRRLEGGERERHLRAMEDATSSPGRTRAASSGTSDPARSDHGQRHKGQDAALARRKALGVTFHAHRPEQSGHPPGVIRATRPVGAPTPSFARETEAAECGRPPGPEPQTGADFLCVDFVGWAIRAFYARLRRAMGAGTIFPYGNDSRAPYGSDAGELLAKRNQDRA